MLSIGSLLAFACTSVASMASDDDHPILARVNNENVILADCTGAQGQLSSEVAYFSGSPDSAPEDIATVTSGKHHDWANTTTSAYFSDTSVTFTAVLREHSDAGDYAGTGNNGYGNFTCWQTDSTYLYSHNNQNCFAMYDCNHLGTPVSLPSASSSPSITPTASSSITGSAAASSSTPAASSGLSVGAIVGLSIGVAAGVLIIAATAILLVWRQRQLKNGKAAAAAAAAPPEKGPESGKAGTPKGPQLTNSIWQGPGVRELESPQVYELHSEYRPAEIHGQALAGELDATPTRAELHCHDLPPRYDFESEDHGSPGVYGNLKGPA
ncbi:hypothetical protein GGR54DRAFT_622539 [Hypoxylon sp. NC1633]|nr:hypothetical protein GGR54DRAFT_622539 [Hypoxylon sp. NC1633]